MGEFQAFVFFVQMLGIMKGIVDAQKVAGLFEDWRNSLISEAKIVYAAEGHTVTMDCSSSTAGRRLLASKIFHRMKITWLIDNYEELVSGSDGRKMIYNVGKFRQSQLVIQYVSNGDTGLYSCNLDKQRHITQRYKMLTYFFLHITQPEDIYVYLGDRFVVECPLDILYETLRFSQTDMSLWRVKWIFGDGNVTLRENQLLNGSLILRNEIYYVQHRHNGLWKCQLHYMGGKFPAKIFPVKQFYLHVVEKPDVLLSISSQQIIKVALPILALVFAILICSHILLAALLFERLARTEKIFQAWSVVSGFSKKNYMTRIEKDNLDE